MHGVPPVHAWDTSSESRRSQRAASRRVGKQHRPRLGLRKAPRNGPLKWIFLLIPVNTFLSTAALFSTGLWDGCLRLGMQIPGLACGHLNNVLTCLNIAGKYNTFVPTAALFRVLSATSTSPAVDAAASQAQLACGTDVYA